MKTPEEVVASFWGFSPEGFMAPLPEVGRFVTAMRGCGDIDGVKEIPWPPYIAAREMYDDEVAMEVMLCEYDGFRASYDPEHADDALWIYADSDDMPQEWREPVAAALEAIRSHWPDRRIVLRPDYAIARSAQP